MRLKFVNAFRDRHGHLRYYVRRPGRKAVPLRGMFGSEEFMADYAAAIADIQSPAIGASRTKTGTVNAAIVGYYASAAFQSLAPVTQAWRRGILEKLRVEHGEKRVALLRTDHVRKLIRPKKPHAQKNWLKSLRGLMQFAVEAKLIGIDPTQGVRTVRVGKSGGHMPWGEGEIALYRARFPLGTVPRVALELMLNVAARRSDACKLGRQHMKHGRLTWRPAKTRRSTGKVLTVPILPELQAALDTMPATDAMTFLTTDYGRPFKSPAAFGNKFADWCREAALEGRLCDDGKLRNFRAHGLRKASCRRLAEAGCTGPEIMAVSGHATLAQVQVYIDDVDQGRMADAAMARIENAKLQPE